ncbi:MAG TPA: TrkA family potassium uptake protein [Spirochaetota bacterium]|nr:TrkA family potassium uptake protein [Spirochaetota bacterium]
MNKFIVIGLGNFGFHIAKTLVENDCEVLGIDSDHETVERAKDHITYAIIGDAANREVLESLSIRDFDCAVVSVGRDMGMSILITLYLKEIGIPKIIVRAITEDHGKILDMLGVSEISFPEKDMAIRLGFKLSLKNALDYLPIGAEYGIVEVNTPDSFVGKNLKELAINTRFHCQIIGIKNNTGVAGASREQISIAPSPDEPLAKGSIMIVLGKEKDIDRIQSLG